jgi:ribose 5-phosphate isomerase A
MQVSGVILGSLDANRHVKGETEMQDDAKRRAGEKAAEYVKDGQLVGLGTGSTTKFAVEKIGQMVQSGLDIKGVPTSRATERLALDLGIPLLDLNEVIKLDVAIDGADEVDPDFNMIKGGGGALTREKLVALAASKRVFVVDDTKLVERLGQTRLLPVEVLPFAWSLSARLLIGTGCKVILRKEGEKVFETDNGNYILDCEYGPIEDAGALEQRIKLLPGVVECGLFISMADAVIVAYDDRVEVRTRDAR